MTRNLDLRVEISCPIYDEDIKKEIIETFDVFGDIGEFNQSITDDLDWTQNSGSTQSLSTGPSDDITGGGEYMYIEASGSGLGYPYKVASLYSNCIDITALNNPCLSFNYHMYGTTMGSLQVLADGVSVWSISGDQGDQWLQSSQIPLTGTTSPIVIRFSGTIGTNYTSDIAIDKVEIF